MFADVLPERQSRRLRRRARRVRKVLAEVRDADVVQDLVRRLRRRAQHRNLSRLAVLDQELAARATSARRRLAPRGGGRLADGPRLRVPGLRRRSAALLLALGPGGARRQPRGAAALLLRRSRAVRNAHGRARGGHAADLHRLRIAVKRYRYTLELLEASGHRLPPQAIAAARAVQEGLGEVHDMDVLMALLRRTAPGAPLLGRLRRERRVLLARARQTLRDFRPVQRLEPGAVPR